MNQKHIGILLIIVAILIGISAFMFKSVEDSYIDSMISEKSSCFLDDGTCLHDDRNWIPYIVSFGASIGLLILGIIMLLDNSSKKLEEHQKNLEKITNTNKEEEKFKAFLRGFSEDERAILESVNAQDGIKQSTLRYKTGLSKSTVSLIVNSLEEKGIISRKKSGKTFEVYLVN